MSSPLSYSLKSHFVILASCLSRRGKFANVFVIAIDPQYSISHPSIIKVSRQMKVRYLPVALTTHIQANTSILHFNIAKNSLSSSFFDTSGQITNQALCPSFKTSDLLEQLIGLQCLSVNDKLILRINSEGSELSIISDIVRYNLNLKLVIGSINDVLKKFGRDEYNQLVSLLNVNHIPYVYFKGSDPSTWCNGISSLDKLLSI